MGDTWTANLAWFRYALYFQLTQPIPRRLAAGYLTGGRTEKLEITPLGREIDISTGAFASQNVY